MADRPSRDQDRVPEGSYNPPERDRIVDPEELRMRDTGGDGATHEGPSIATIVQDIVQDVQGLVRSEVRLAKTEMKEEATTAAKAAAMLAAGALVALYALGFLLVVAYLVLENVMADWLAALIVGVVLAVIAGALVMVGRKKLKEFNPKPDDTIQTVKEDVKWAKQQVK